MKKAVLFIHGLSAKKEDNIYLLDQLRTYKNIELYTFTLPGHENDTVSKATGKEWIEKSEAELKEVLKRHKRVTIVAHSMGTILAVNLASRYKEVEKLVLLSSAFIFGNFKQNKDDLVKVITGKVDKEVGTGFEGALKKFFAIPKSVMIEYKKLADSNKENIKKIKCPTLIMHGSIDNVISIKSSRFVYDNLTCPKDFVTIKNVRHQLFKSRKKEIIVQYIYNFITFNILYELNKKDEI